MPETPPPVPSQSGPGGRRLRLARLGRGLSQRQLAQSCGISRQALAGVESGAWSPSLGLALRLARALGSTVDELFSVEPGPEELEVVALATGAFGDRARITRVFERWVALPLKGEAAWSPGFLPANGSLGEAGRRAVLRGGAGGLVVAGCDPGLGLLAASTGPREGGWSVHWWPCGSRDALRLLGEGLVHAAQIHYPAAERPGAMPGRARIGIGFARWREGLLFRRPGPEPTSLAEAARLGWRWINREPGAEARALLDRELDRADLDGRELPGYDSRALSHFAVAAAVASRSADVGLAAEPVALAFGLGFLPLSEEESVLVVEQSRLGTEEGQQLLRLLGRPALGRELGAVPGYDAGICGEALPPGAG